MKSSKISRPLCPVCRRNYRKAAREMCGRCERLDARRPNPGESRPLAVRGIREKLCTHRGETYVILWCGVTRFGDHMALIAPPDRRDHKFWVKTGDVSDVRRPPRPPRPRAVVPARPPVRHWLDAQLDRRLADDRA